MFVLLPAFAWLLTQFAMTGAIAQAADPDELAEKFAGAGAFAPGVVVICTPTGLKLIDLESDDGGAPGEKESYAGCAWCQPFSAVPDIAGPGSDGLILPDCTALRYELRDPQVLAGSLFAFGFRSRAPPL